MLQIIQAQFHVGRIARIPKLCELELARSGLLALHPPIPPPITECIVDRSMHITYASHFEAAYFATDKILDEYRPDNDLSQLNIPMEPKEHEDDTYAHFIISVIDTKIIDAPVE